MEFKENIKGITLVTCAVTIIVLIILAGVSINSILGENGIINKAQELKENIELAKKEEEEELKKIEIVIQQENNKEKSIIEGPIEGGNYDNPYIPIGFIHVEGEGMWNSGYIIKEISTGNEFVWVPCVSNQSKVKTGDNVETFKKKTTENYNKFGFKLLPTDINVKTEDSSVAEIEISVEKYGGFYISRYEAGIEGIIDNDTLGKTILTSTKPLSKKGKGVWNSISRLDAIRVSKNMINTEKTGAKSTLISGAAWDTTLQWIVNSSDNASNESNVEYDIDSTKKGWYEQDNVNTTGQYQINNIYDMAGNIYEWTTENCIYFNDDYYVIRGGYYAGKGIEMPASIRGIYYDDVLNTIGFRVVMYK